MQAAPHSLVCEFYHFGRQLICQDLSSKNFTVVVHSMLSTHLQGEGQCGHVKSPASQPVGHSLYVEISKAYG